MGQYYKPLTINDDVVLAWGNSDKFEETRDYKYYMGVKLTEHSWVGNPLTNAMSNHLWKNPTRLAWVGDYSNDKGWTDDQTLYAKNKVYYPRVWVDPPEEKYHWEWDDEDFDYEGCWLINHDKKVAFPMPYYEGEPKSFEDWIPYPVSLLTACGNGLGGGDYHGTSEDLVGSWAYDLIEIDDEAPKGYQRIHAPYFKERS